MSDSSPNLRLTDNPLLKRLLRQFDPQDLLFKQQDSGQSMFLILSGRVQLVADRDRCECIIDTVEAGEFIGERAMFQSQAFQRFCSAKALTNVTALELTHNELANLEKESPELSHLLVKRAFGVASERLARLNQLAGLLRTTDERRRFLNYWHFRAKVSKKKELKGIRVEVAPSELFYYLGIPLATCTEWVKRLESLKVLISEGAPNEYTIPDETAFLTLDLIELPKAA